MSSGTIRRNAVGEEGGRGGEGLEPLVHRTFVPFCLHHRNNWLRAKRSTVKEESGERRKGPGSVFQSPYSLVCYPPNGVGLSSAKQRTIQLERNDQSIHFTEINSIILSLCCPMLYRNKVTCILKNYTRTYTYTHTLGPTLELKGLPTFFRGF